MDYIARYVDVTALRFQTGSIGQAVVQHQPLPILKQCQYASQRHVYRYNVFFIFFHLFLLALQIYSSSFSFTYLSAAMRYQPSIVALPIRAPHLWLRHSSMLRAESSRHGSSRDLGTSSKSRKPRLETQGCPLSPLCVLFQASESLRYGINGIVCPGLI